MHMLFASMTWTDDSHTGIQILHHSWNYRSVVVGFEASRPRHGTARNVDDEVPSKVLVRGTDVPEFTDLEFF